MNVVSDLDIGLIANVDIFAHLDENALERLKSQGEIRQYSVGETMVTENDPAEDIYFLLTGDAQVQIPGTGFIELKQGGVFGESALLQGDHFLPPGWRLEKRNATVVAQNDVQALVFQADTLSLLLREYPEVRQSLVDLAASRSKS